MRRAANRASTAHLEASNPRWVLYYAREHQGGQQAGSLREEKRKARQYAPARSLPSRCKPFAAQVLGSKAFMSILTPVRVESIVEIDGFEQSPLRLAIGPWQVGTKPGDRSSMPSG
jgi:hypothetical protein